nr:hypothetical protein FNV92_23305 [Bradyrhizobium cosmicum]
MAGLVPAIHVLTRGTKNVDARDEPGHDEAERLAEPSQQRHCERSEAIQTASAEAVWIASSLRSSQ